LIWPNVTVSRTGSNTLTSGMARHTANQRGQPCRSATGMTSQAVVITTATAEATHMISMAWNTDIQAIGYITSAANGGYVKPR
jgi:hypothetical protein